MQMSDTPVTHGFLGLDTSEKDSKLILLPVPWDATTSYGDGTCYGPEAILKASSQLDLFDLDVSSPHEPGIHFLNHPQEIAHWNLKAKSHAIRYRERLYSSPSILQVVNDLSQKKDQWVYEQAKTWLNHDKLVGVIGGDHSCPLGAIQAIAGFHSEFGILHFDAHFDLRKSYENFEGSHASIMYNVLETVPQVKKLVQVGIRDFCQEEWDYSKAQAERCRTFAYPYLAESLQEGKTWQQLAKEMVEALPEKVWVSFDIDGLDPKLCPNTGTPVPGGLEFYQANTVLKLLASSGRKIIGFDLCEVTPSLNKSAQTSSSEWDANVGARVLYKLATWTFLSQGICQGNL